jgi:apolipoprotein N-acyltransferase
MASKDTHQPEPGSAKPPRRARFVRRLLPDDWKRSLGLGLVASVGYAGSFPPLGLWPLVILPVWATIRAADPASKDDSTRPRPSPLWFAIGTIPAFAWLTRWAAESALAGYPLLVLYLAGFAGLAVWAMSRIRRRLPMIPAVVAVPVVWVGVEAFRGLLAFDGFPWFLAEHPLIDAGGGSPLLAWPAMFGGVWLVAILLAVVAVIIDKALRARRMLGPTIGCLVSLAIIAAIGFVLSTAIGKMRPTSVVAIIQTNVPQSTKTGWTFDDRWADWQTLREMLLAAGEPDEDGVRPDFIVLPETMFPGMVLQDDAAAIERANDVAWIFEPVPVEEGGTGQPGAIRAETVRDQFLRASRQIGDIPIFVGATRFEGFRIDRAGNLMNYEHDARFNSVFVVRDGEVSETTYDKQHLTPFGEVMPYISEWDWLERLMLGLGAGGMTFDLDGGKQQTVFEVSAESMTVGAARPVEPETIRVVAPICYEATVGAVCRDLVFGGDGDSDGRRADAMLNLTNDGWFYDKAGGHELHLMMARWRCLELGTPMVRAANTGISAVIGTNGEVIASLDPNEAGILIAAVPGVVNGNSYARIGDALGWFCLAGAIFGLAASYLPMQSRSAQKQTAPTPRGGD